MPRADAPSQERDDTGMADSSAAPLFTPHHTALDEAALDQLFRDARSLNSWQKRDVPDALLH